MSNTTTAIERINPPIPVITPRGPGLAIFLIDYGPDLNSVWVVRHDETGDVYHVVSCEIRVCGNEMWNLGDPIPFDVRKI